MTNLSYHNHLSRHSKPKSMAVIGLSELWRAAAEISRQETPRYIARISLTKLQKLKM